MDAGPGRAARLRAAARLLGAKLGESRGQALPVAIAALAAGALLIVPLLSGASTDSLATAQVGRRAWERYSMDAGIEWSGWRLMANPRLTTDTSFNATVLQPFPPGPNGLPFPATEIRFIPGAGATEAQALVWQGGGGQGGGNQGGNGGNDQCYTFSASDAGTLSARVTVNSGQVWMALLAAGAACVEPAGLQPLPGASPYGADFSLPAAGTYQLLIGVDSATSGSISLSVPAATYEARSSVGSRNEVARIVAGYSGVRVASWQLN
ncbi:MAG: hypothetical protein KGK07_12995 [Chloroflexota bacterium]|nr:hypothetical protein [Chloroflexota bacterium]